jgi:hypothetical protein
VSVSSADALINKGEQGGRKDADRHIVPALERVDDPKGQLHHAKAQPNRQDKPDYRQSYLAEHLFDHRVLLSRTFHAVTLPIVVNPDPRGPVALNSRAGVPQAELSFVDRPGSSIGVPQDNATQFRQPDSVQRARNPSVMMVTLTGVST